MGVKTDTMIENTFGGYDMQSHGWRSEMLYLGNQLFVDENGAKITLEQILMSKIDKNIDEYNKKTKEEPLKDLKQVLTFKFDAKEYARKKKNR